MNLNLYARSLAGLRFGIDVDGVLYDFCWEFFRHVKFHSRVARVRELFIHIRFSPPRSWTFYKDDWKWTEDDFFAVYAEAIDHGKLFSEGRPLPGCVEGMRRLTAAGAELYVITDRNLGSPGVARMKTVSWLLRHAVPHTELIIKRDKAEVCAELDITAMVDDALHNHAALTAAGIRCVVPCAAYNQGHEGVEYVDGFPLFVDRMFEDYGK